MRRLQAAGVDPLECVLTSLEALGVPEAEWDAFLSDTLLAFRGWAGMVRQAVDAFGRIDVLVNNAGVYRGAAPLETTEEQWDLVLGVNARAVLFCTLAVLPTMQAAGRGCVISIASMAGKIAQPNALAYGITSVPLAYAPPIADPAELTFVKEDKPDGPGLATCWRQAEPARQLPNLQKMPILVLTAEASYHAPYDHCTVKYLQQAGVRPTFIRLADLGIRGNSHVMMLEKNNKEIAAVIARWLAQALPTTQ